MCSNWLMRLWSTNWFNKISWIAEFVRKQFIRVCLPVTKKKSVIKKNSVVKWSFNTSHVSWISVPFVLNALTWVRGVSRLCQRFVTMALSVLFLLGETPFLGLLERLCAFLGEIAFFTFYFKISSALLKKVVMMVTVPHIFWFEPHTFW